MATKPLTAKKRQTVSVAGGRKAKTVRRTVAARRAARTPRGDGLKRLFPKLLSAQAGSAEGALLAVASRSETGLEVRSVVFERTTGASDGRKRRRPAAICPNTNETARLLRGLAHAERLHILDAMRQGARKHIEIKAAVKLAAGPLYHHLRELERCGLIECPSRNDYILTGSGRSAILLVAGLYALAGEPRLPGPWRKTTFRKRLTMPAKPKRRHR